MNFGFGFRSEFRVPRSELVETESQYQVYQGSQPRQEPNGVKIGILMKSWQNETGVFAALFVTAR